MMSLEEEPSCQQSPSEDDPQLQHQQQNPLLKSIKSAWTKARKTRRPFRRWKRSMDIERASRLDIPESKEDALFYTAKEDPLDPAAVTQTSNTASRGALASGCVCLRYTSNTMEAPRHPEDILDTLRPLTGPQNRVTNPRANFQVDYISYLIPGQQDILTCPFYWGKMDRYEAEALLSNKPEGSFLLRDSAQDDYVFSVSFRRYSRSLHARIEETGHKFSFDCHDPGVHASSSIRGLLFHYKDPLSCMFFEPMLLFPVLRKTPFTLQELARTVICDNTTYNGVSKLPMPKTLELYLREYHYRHKLESRILEIAPSVLRSFQNKNSVGPADPNAGL